MKTTLHLLLFACTFFVTRVSAQIPTNCLEIESILVDACGTPENGNEMVRFKVGPNPLDASQMIVDWPNNSWLGLIQDAQTATATSGINATITSCGYLIEPPAFILPAGANVLLITSQFVDVTANSFANLSDTIYVLYQNLPVPSTSGHFANYNATPGLRTLIIDFTSPANCGDTVTYDRSLLIGGNGAIANFEWDGTVSYDNNGCQAPIIPSGIDITTPTPLTLCPGASINLTSAPFGTYTEIIWSGGTGSFSVNDVENTTYVSTLSDVDDFYLYAGIRTTCNDIVMDSILVSILQPTAKAINPSTYDLCPGETITLTASGGTDYLWNTFAISPSISVSSANTYSVTISDGCYVETVSATITDNGIAPTLSLSGDFEICAGASTTITATGTGIILWNGSVTGSTFTTSTPDNYTVTATNGCGVATENFTIIDLGSAPAISIAGNLELCNGSATTITASGAAAYEWSDLSTGSTFTTAIAGNYSVSATNICGTDVVNFEIIDLGATPTLVLSGDLEICQGESTVITASGGSTYIWNGSTIGSTFTAGTPGNYTVEATNACGSVSESFTIIDLGQAPSLSISGNLEICAGESTTISATGADDYLWSDNSAGTTLAINTPGDYFVSSTNVCGSDQIDFTIVDLGSAPTLVVTGDLEICDGENTTLTATGNGNFVWNSTISGATFTTNVPGTYVVEATNNCGAVSESVTVISLGAYPDALLQGALEICDANEVTTLTVSGGIDYLWSNGNAANTESFGAGSHFVVAATNCGTDTVFFDVINHQVTANFTPSTTSGTEPLLVEFTNTSVGATAYNWSFGTGENSLLENVGFTYSEDGVYTVVLTASNNHCLDTSVVLILVNPLPELIIPNIFTPNNDGANDLFLVSNIIITSIEGAIFNRWGQQMYIQDSNSVFSWDGRTPVGNEVPEGTYYYVLNIVLINGESKTFSGHFDLKR
jgi:gliding motility-associated-like protein